MRLVILKNYEAASEWAAKYVRNAINKFNPGPDKHFVLGLPTGTEKNKIHVFWDVENFEPKGAE